MKVNIQEFVKQAGLDEPFYPGKRVVKPCPQPGEYKSHCVVYDWRDPVRIRIEIKAGLTGRDLPTKDLVRYPVSFQAQSFIEIDVEQGTIRTVSRAANDDDEEGEDTSGKGKSSGGGKRPALKKPEEKRLSLMSFADAAEGLLPEAGKIVNMVIMGMKIAEEAYGKVLDTFFGQVQHAKIAATDLIASAGKMITKFTPPAFLKPKGDESAVYKYDRTKNEAMFTGMMPT
jgi:hypothetical protein